MLRYAALRYAMLRCVTIRHVASRRIASRHVTPSHVTSRYVTSHHITSHCIPSHRIAAHHIPLHHFTSHCIASHRIASHLIKSHFIESHHITSYYVTLRHVTLSYYKLHYVILYYIMSHYVTAIVWLLISSQWEDECKLTSLISIQEVTLHFLRMYLVTFTPSYSSSTIPLLYFPQKDTRSHFVLISPSCKYFHCILYTRKRNNRHQDCMLRSCIGDVIQLWTKWRQKWRPE